MKAVTLAGHWWLPSGHDRRVAGILRYEMDRFPELDLMESLTDTAGEIERAVVLGLSGDAEPVTAEVDFETDRSSISTRQGHRVVRQTVGIRRAFVGAHLPDSADRRFKRISVEFTDLHRWTGWRGPEDEWVSESVTVRYREPGEMISDVGWGQLRLRPHWGVDGDGISSRGIRVGAEFLCERREAADIDTWLDEVVRPLRDFITVATDRPNQVEAVALQWADGEPSARLIYPPAAVELPTRTAHVFEFPFTATLITDKLASVLARWFTIYGELSPALDLFLSTLYRPSTHLENRFLNTAGAAEAYHRRTSPASPEVVDRHRERLTRIADSVTHRRDRDWLNWRLKYAYEPSFADRLAELASRAGELLLPWLGDSTDFARRVSDVRNVLVHRDPEAGVELPNGRTIIDMMEDLGLVFLVCLYQDLGFEADRIREMLRRTRRWRFLEFRKRGWRE